MLDVVEYGQAESLDSTPTPRSLQEVRTLGEPFVTSSDALLSLCGTAAALRLASKLSG